jgi:hypothetical protein
MGLAQEASRILILSAKDGRWQRLYDAQTHTHKGDTP